jgi:predicted AlkP superfamily pyrophosphatase or phosphodiesterase
VNIFVLLNDKFPLTKTFISGHKMKLFLILVIILSAVHFPVSASDDSKEIKAANQPSLVVVVAVDQLRRDRVTSGFNGGLGKLVSNGKVFSSAQLNHGMTNTCPGHAVMLTGVNPGRAGIPSNDYVDRKEWENRYCVHDEDPANVVFGNPNQRSPKALRVTTLGDWLKKSDSGAKVFAVGGKDRSTITMAGHGADGVYWFDASQGIFTSSRYYVDHLPKYVSQFNGTTPLVEGYLAGLPDQWIHPGGTYREDDYPGEDSEFENSSGHPLKQGSLQDVGKQVYRSPFVDEATFELATIIVEKEKLGQRASTDVLAIALSATDTVGHSYGPFSAESEDTLNRIDEDLGDFLDFLDAEVGDDNYIVVLTADHGVAELPEWSIENGRLECPDESGRADIIPSIISLYWYVYSQFTFPVGNPLDLVRFAGSEVSVNRDYASVHGIDPDEVLLGLKNMLESKAVIKRVWTSKEVKEGAGLEAKLLRNSYVDGKSGDLLLQINPTCMIRGSGTSHGSIYDYDRNIPLVFFGNGIQAGESEVEAHSVDIGPTLAAFLGIENPQGLDGKALRLD